MKYIFTTWRAHNNTALGLKVLCAGTLLCGTLLSVGCNRQEREVTDLRDPLLRQAHTRMREGDRQGALEALNRVLSRKPDLAPAHLDAALLYDDYKKDYIRAIYHYSRYLEMQPHAEKRDMIEGLINNARMAYNAQLADQGLVRDHRVRQLQAENAQLRADLRDLRANLAKAQLAATGVKAPTLTPATPLSAPAPIAQLTAPSVATETTETSTTITTYQVQPRDTLSIIAAKIYQNPRQWNIIYEANRDLLPTPDKLNVGMILKIPAITQPAD